MVKLNTPVRICCCSKTEPQAIGHRDNSHVSKILPVTTFRTIDLGGKKNSSPLFSRFCAEMRFFFEVNSAPEYVHQRQVARASATSAASFPTLAKNARMGHPRFGSGRETRMTTAEVLAASGKKPGDSPLICLPPLRKERAKMGHPSFICDSELRGKTDPIFQMALHGRGTRT
jgi:hypothetical protein